LPADKITTQKIIRRKSWLILRLGLVLLPLLALGIAIYGLLASPLRLVQPENPAVTPLAREIGQRFKVEHTGLRSISLKLPASLAQAKPEKLQLHLREAIATVDLRTVKASAAGASENWLRFDFVPLESFYNEHSLVFIIEAEGAAFRLAGSVAEVYRDGESYLDGAAQAGDLSFALEYSPDPAGLLATYFERQATYGGPAWFGLVALASWLVLAVSGCIWLVLSGPRLSSENIRRLTVRQFWPVALYFGLLGASGGLAFMFLTPPLQGLDEQGHVGRVIMVYHYDSDPSKYADLYRAELELETKARYLEYVPGFDYEQSPLNQLFFGPLSEYYQPPIYYAVAGGLVRLGSWLTDNQNFLFQQYLVRLTSLLFGLGGLAIALAWAYYLRREAPWLLLSVPAAYAMLPGYLFIIGVANNDNAPNFFVPMVILAVTVLYKEGFLANYNWAFWRKWWPMAAIGLGSSGLAYMGKHTAGVFLGTLALAIFFYFGQRLSKLIRWLLLAGLTGAIVVAASWLLLRTPWQLQALFDFLGGTNSKNRLLLIFQVLILTHQSFWASIGWLNFGDLAGGWLLPISFLIWLVAIWGLLRQAAGGLAFYKGILHKETEEKMLKENPTGQAVSYRLKRSWPFYLALTLGLASLAHVLALIFFRILTSYVRLDQLLDFPQGRFFLLALLPLAALFFSGWRACLPAKVRERSTLWLGFYCWLFSLLIYGLLVIFGSFLPYYYNQN